MSTKITKITIDMVDAIKVKFLKPISEEDFVEKGMVAWLTDIQWDSDHNCYKLYFDFSEFENENDKYFKEVYNSNTFTTGRAEYRGSRLYTAKEAGYYSPKYSVLFSASIADTRDDKLFEIVITDFLVVID